MQKHQKFIVLTALLTLAIFSFGFFIRYIIDPVGINNKFDVGLKKDVALAYRTQKFVELNEFEPNTVLVGGSRVQYLNTNDAQKYTKDRVYNLGLQFSTLQEQYYFLKHTLENHPINSVIIGLNFYPFSEKIKDNNSDFNENIFKYNFNIFYQIKHYLEVPLFKYLQYIIPNNDKNLDYENGSITLYHQNKVINNNDKESMWQSTLKHYENVYDEYLVWGDTNFNYYKKMVELCNFHQVDLKVFITSIHNSQLKLIEEKGKKELFDKWKEKLATLYPYWDFMYEHTISSNADNFIDPSHLKQEFGYLYFARLFNDTSVEIPQDFGRFVEVE